jgi:hypothetical protein
LRDSSPWELSWDESWDLVENRVVSRQFGNRVPLWSVVSASIRTGLKIRVSAVRFRPWPLTEVQATQELRMGASGGAGCARFVRWSGRRTNRRPTRRNGMPCVTLLPLAGCPARQLGRYPGARSGVFSRWAPRPRARPWAPSAGDPASRSAAPAAPFLDTAAYRERRPSSRVPAIRRAGSGRPPRRPSEMERAVTPHLPSARRIPRDRQRPEGPPPTLNRSQME